MSSTSTDPKPLPDNAVWFITGCSSGIGRALVKNIRANGHRVVATARNLDSLSYLPDGPNVLKIQLDVTSSENVIAAFASAIEKFSRIDVVVNNAGYSYYGDFEAGADPANDSEARHQMDTNFWGVVYVTREALKTFREVNPKSGDIGGVIVQVSSMGGRVGYPGGSFYHASKFAIEGLTEAIQKELKPEWNIQFLIVEPGGVKTEYAKGSMKILPPHPAYADPSMPTRTLEGYMKDEGMRATWMDPEILTWTLFNVINFKGVRTKEGLKKMPFRLLLGGDAYGMVVQEMESVLSEMKEWKNLSVGAGGEETLKNVDFLSK